MVDSTVERLRSSMREGYDSEARRLLAALTGPTTDLPGLPARPSPDELGAALARNFNRLAEARAAVYASSLNRDAVIALLGVSSQQVSNLLRASRLVEVDGPDGGHFPTWQFDIDGSSPRLDGVDRVVSAYPGGVVSLSLWATASNPILDGRTPAEALRDGEVDLVVAAAHAAHAG